MERLTTLQLPKDINHTIEIEKWILSFSRSSWLDERP